MFGHDMETTVRKEDNDTFVVVHKRVDSDETLSETYLHRGEARQLARQLKELLDA